MKMKKWGLWLAALFVALAGGSARADLMQAVVVPACNATGLTYPVGGSARNLVMDPTGLLCTPSGGGGGGGGTSSNFGSVFPTAGTALGMTDGTNMIALKGDTTNGAWVAIKSAVTIGTSVSDGADVTLGAKADAKSTATDTTPITLMSVAKQISASVQAAASSLAGTLTVATHAVTQSGTWTVQPGNTANTTAWKVDGSAVTQPVSGTVAVNPPTALAPVVGGSAISSQVLKNSAGSLNGVYATCTAACWLMVFNSTAAPSDGATTSGVASGNLQDCIPIAAGGIGGVSYSPGAPEIFSVGITAAISSTACVTKTAATVGFIHGVVQ